MRLMEECKLTQQTLSGYGRSSVHERVLQLSGALQHVVEWLFYVILALLPIDAYLTLLGTSKGVFLSQVLVAVACVLVVCCLALNQISGRSDFLGLRLIDVV